MGSGSVPGHRNCNSSDWGQVEPGIYVSLIFDIESFYNLPWLIMTKYCEILWNMAQSSPFKGALPTLSRTTKRITPLCLSVAVSPLPAADIPCKIVSTRTVPNRRTLYTNPIRRKCRPISSAFPNILLQFHLMLNSALMLTTTSPVTMSQKDSQCK